MKALSAVTMLAALLAACAIGPRAGAAEEPPVPPIVGSDQTEEPPPPPMLGSEPEVPPPPPIVGSDSEVPPPPPVVGGEPAVPPVPPTGGAQTAAPAESRTFSDFLDKQLKALPFPLHGFWEVRVGPRYVEDNRHPHHYTLGESRLQLKSDPYVGPFRLGLKADFLYDAVTADALMDVREANVEFTPFSFMDVKAGRQVLTWGTGDLLFINDLFPKDYVSFFTGRDVEYLKAPSDALKVSLFGLPGDTNLNIVYVPVFNPDVFPNGKRLTYYNYLLRMRAGSGARLRTIDRDDWFNDDELHVRLYRNVGSYELDAYGYRGYWKAPMGVNTTKGKFTFPRLNAYGASVRGPALGGIGNVEVGYYDSPSDSTGSNPLIPNSQFRFLVGYSRDLPQLTRDFTVGVQYYLEHMMDYGALKRTWPAGLPRPDEDRHVLTLRLTKLMLNQDLTLSYFTYWSPSDHDVYMRPHASYKITDRWVVDGGANVFLGQHSYTQFGQFKSDSNVYVGLRYSF